MSAPYFTTNDSDIPQLEGLYVKERNPPATISGAFLGKVCMVGETVRGPVGRAVDISSEGRFQEVFGYSNRANDSGPITNKIWKALLNKPFGALSIVRVAAAAAAAATHNFSDAVPTAIVKVDASSVGAWGNDLSAQIVVPSSDGVAGRFDLKVKWAANGREWIYKNLDFTGTNDNSLQVLGTDDANPVVVTKLASGTPVAAAYVALAGGSDGSVADSDYTATGKALEVGAVAEGCGVVLTAEHMSSTVKAKIYNLSATVSDRIFLMAPDSETVSAASAITEAASYRTDRVVYCFNSPYTVDPRTAAEMVTSPDSWMASILSQVDVDINPGEEDAKQFTQGITRLYNTGLQRADYISLRQAGIAALEKDNGFAFVSAVTTSLTSGKEQITRRRSADYIQLSLARGLKFNVKKKNTLSRRAAIVGNITAFLSDLEANERIVEAFLVDGEKLNTPSQRAAGIEKELIRVRLIGHILELVLETEIGTAVVITEQ